MLSMSGQSGTGMFAQSGGTNTVSNNGGGLFLARDSNSRGLYNLSGAGVLFTNTEYVGSGGTGTFNHSGGTNYAGSPYSGGIYLSYNAGSSGSYNLSDAGVAAVKR